MKPYLKKRFEVYHGVADLYSYFFERGLRLLKPCGRLGYISSCTFFKTGSGKPLRDFLRTQATLETVIDFGDQQVFEGVTVYPAVLTLKGQKPQDSHNLLFWKLDDALTGNFQKAFDVAALKYPQQSLTGDSWELESTKLLALRMKIIGQHRILKDVFESPNYGIKTGRNEAFVVSEAEYNSMISADPAADEIVGPLSIGDDLALWHYETRREFLVCTYRGVDIDKYPSVLRHLEKFREILEPKPATWKPLEPRDKWKGRKKGTYKWYELQDSVNYHNEFKKSKIVYPEFSQGPKFSMDMSGRYLNNKCFFIQTDDFSLLALLNSKPIWFFLSGQSASQRGGEWRLELRTQYMEKLPIPDATPTQKAKLAEFAEACQTAAEERYKLQQDLTRRIPDLALAESVPKLSNKLKTWWELPDFAAFQTEVKKALKSEIPLSERNDWEDWIARDKAEIARLTAEIKAREDRINTIVYELFELTPEEIELLEANI